MTKAELVDTVAARLQLTKQQTDTVVTIFVQCITDALRVGDKVELRGFGSFRVRARQARTGRSPKTGVPVEIPAKQVPFFKAGQALRALVDSPPSPRSSRPRTRSALSTRV
jgi:integration host factor subunit beta